MIWLDLFCGAGLVADGLRAAGDEVIGVDIKAQPDYPGEFIKLNCLDFFRQQNELKWCWPRVIVKERQIDAIWASPPCLRDTEMRHAPGAKGKAHPDLITPTRAWLQATGLPYVIENVPGAPLEHPRLTLWGPQFDLGVDWNGIRYHLKRERIFESNWDLHRRVPMGNRSINEVWCPKPVVTIVGGHARVRSAAAGGRGTADFVGYPGGHRMAMGRAMGVPDDRRITCSGISDGIPPAYARYVAEQLHDHMQARRLERA